MNKQPYLYLYIVDDDMSVHFSFEIFFKVFLGYR